jgi:hypothetical protein
MKLLIALITANVVLGAAVWSEVIAQRHLGQRLSIEDVTASREPVGLSSEAIGLKKLHQPVTQPNSGCGGRGELRRRT